MSINYLELYDQMRNQELQEVEKTAEAQEVDERMEVLYKYASLADNFLAQELGNDYHEEDVVKLAHKMILHDLEQEEIETQEAMDKVAEFYQYGRLVGKGFKDEINQ